MIPEMEWVPDATEKLFKNFDNRPCGECIWHTEDGCSSWDCEPVTRKEARERLKKGKWIECDHEKWSGDTFAYRCSECGGAYHLNIEKTISIWDYCPNCGAKMEVEHETD